MGPLRVIIINEVDGARRNLKNMLTRHGFIIVAEVKDAASGVRALSNNDVELIITEDVTAGWREIVQFAQEKKRTPVLLIISQEDDSIAGEAAKLGVAGLVVRPLTERNLAVMARFIALGAPSGPARKLNKARASERLKKQIPAGAIER